MPVTDLCSWVAVIRKLDVTSALGVVSSNKCFSRVQNTAAASTRVGVCASQVSNTAADGSGRILFLQYLINSCRPDGVVDVFGGSGGVESGEICPGSRMSCNEGGTAAARTSVNCSGEIRPAMSANPLATLA